MRTATVFRRILFGLLLGVALLTAPHAFAQCPTVANATPQFTAGGSVFGRIASAWNTYFGSKVDANNGTLCNTTIENPYIVGGNVPTLNGPNTFTAPNTFTDGLIANKITSPAINQIITANPTNGIQAALDTVPSGGVIVYIQPGN